MESARQLFDSLLKLAEKHKNRSTGYVFESQRPRTRGLEKEIRFYAAGCTMLLRLKVPFSNSTIGIRGEARDYDAHLELSFSDGVIDEGRFYHSDDQPKIIQKEEYKFDADGEGDVGWRKSEAETLKNSKSLSIELLSRFIDFAEANRSY